jgi:hypothetical protein
MIHLSIIHPSTLGSSEWSLSFRFPNKNPIRASCLLLACYMSRPSHYSPFYHQNNSGWEVPNIKLLIMCKSPE